jgi:divalent metal cation (Fe/Co/Zn/Cd) transporter
MKFAFSAVMAALSVYILFFLFNINNNVAKDFETQYYMALSNGSRMQVGVQAGLVAGLFAIIFLGLVRIVTSELKLVWVIILLGPLASVFSILAGMLVYIWAAGLP